MPLGISPLGGASRLHGSQSVNGHSSSRYCVELDFFTGPLDLLLHLVNQQEVSVSQVDMTSIASQYLAIITEITSLDLHIATEYLVIAATLLAIKSQSLLQEGGYLEESEIEEGSEFYEELRERLKRYEEVKLQALHFQKTPQLGFDTFVRRERNVISPIQSEVIAAEDPQSLGFSFVKLLKRIGATLDSLRIQLEPISVVNYMMRVINTLQVLPTQIKNDHSTGTFFRLLALFKNEDLSRRGTGDDSGRDKHVLQELQRKTNRGVVIGSFIAVLELVKRGVLTVFQGAEEGDIELSLSILETAGADLHLESEFDGEVKGEVKGEEETSPKVIDIERYREDNKADTDYLDERKEANRE